MPIVSCKLCAETFHVKPSHLKMGYGKYCSAKCQYKARKTGKMVVCYICGKDTYKTIKALRNSKSKKYFCGKSCQTKWRNSEFIGSKHANFVNGYASYRTILSRDKIPKICILCQTIDKRILLVHHIDENHYNNNLKNLSWLCHNCHFLVHHDKVEKVKFLTKVRKS